MQARTFSNRSHISLHAVCLNGIRWICLLLAGILCFSFCSCGKTDPGTVPTSLEDFKADKTVGLGKETIHFAVQMPDGTVLQYAVKTDATTLGTALLENGLIKGEEGAYGLYVKTVDGETADWDTDGTYWAFYINGEYASTGVDATEVEDGATYAFKVE